MRVATAPTQRNEGRRSPGRRYARLLALVVALGVGLSLSISYALYRDARSQWVAHAEADAQKLSTLILGWFDESYAPLSGLAALVENSRGTEAREFLNAFDGIESRAAPVLLGAAALLEQDAQGRWAVVVSSGNFVFLGRDAADGWAELEPLIELAAARPNQFVLGSPVREGEGLISPVLIALVNVKTPTVLVGQLEYANLQAALVGASTPPGLYLTLRGRFVNHPGVRPIIEAQPAPLPLLPLVTRAASGGADLEIVWGVTKAYGNGPDYAVAATTLGGGMTATLLFGLFMAGLIKRNRVINERVEEATAALRISGEELGRAHELVRRAFGRYVSEEVAESLLRTPDALELGGEERETTILMSDLRGFTAMAERMSPRAVIEVLNLYLEAMVEVISRYEGTIDEISGDAILVIFGAPVTRADHAARAVACGLAMQLAMEGVNRRLTEEHRTSLEMGIGIHTGRVIVGNIGSLRRTKYAAVGSNVNLASRVESFTTGGQVLITEDTYRRISASLRIDGQVQVEPKGVTQHLLLYEIGGIGPPFSLSLPSQAVPLRRLAEPLPVQFTVLEEKFVGRTVYQGHLTEMSDAEARLRSALTPVLLSNLKITVGAGPEGNPAGEIYGKVIDAPALAPDLARVRFTSTTPELKRWVKAWARYEARGRILDSGDRSSRSGAGRGPERTARRVSTPS